jgi:hypothetical protein
MGKGLYFVRKICKLEKYVLKHKKLLVTHYRGIHGQETLLDNEVIQQRIKLYLATMHAGAVSFDMADTCELTEFVD